MIGNPELSQKEIERVKALMAEGFAHHQAGKLASAKRRYREVLKIDPNEADCLHFMGIICHQEGRNSDAIPYLQQAVSARENFLAALLTLSKILLIEGRFHDALKTAQSVLEIDPNAHQALRTVAQVHYQLHEFQSAYDAYVRIDELCPGEISTIRNIALSLGALQRRDEAVEMYRKALALEVENSITRLGLASALKAAGAFDDALVELDYILDRKPTYVAAVVHKGTVLDALGRHDEAEAVFRNALALDTTHPEAHFNLGLSLLSKGNLREGWGEYAWRMQTDTFVQLVPPTAAPFWQGEDINGRSILLFPEQGMGDTVQFVRYVQPLTAKGAVVYCCCPAPLYPLVRTIEGASGVFPLGEAMPDVDFQISMMELPRLLGTELDNIPLAGGYLKAPDVPLARGDDLAVGLVWHGNPSHERDMLRSMDLRQLAPILEIPDIRYFSLQVGAGVAQIAEYGYQDRIENLSGQLTDFSVTAGTIDKLDLVITVDTSVAHVAGAVGKPVWLMLPTAADWRWGRSGETTPWYSKMRIFRQDVRGDWESVVERIRAGLQVLAIEHKH